MPESTNTEAAPLRVAVLGIGTMGGAMARVLLRAGLRVTVWNRSPEKTRALADAGAVATSSPRDAVRDADVVLTMLFDSEAVRDVAADFLPEMRPGAIWMQSSTIGPAAMSTIAAAAAAHGVAVVDAPVLGTKDPAEHGLLTVLGSGDAEAVATLQPIFDAIGSKTIVVGERVGEASALKLVCNAWVGSLTAGTAQSVALSRAFGLNPALFFEAISGSASDSPYAHLKGKELKDGARAPQFALEGLLKDLRLARAAVGSSMTTAYLDGLVDVYAKASAEGHGHEDVAWVYDAMVTSP